MNNVKHNTNNNDKTLTHTVKRPIYEGDRVDEIQFLFG